MKPPEPLLHSLPASLLILLSPTVAQAYIGPGVGAGALAVTLALIFGVFLLVAGLVWYPLKRMLGGMKRGKGDKDMK